MRDLQWITSHLHWHTSCLAYQGSRTRRVTKVSSLCSPEKALSTLLRIATSIIRECFIKIQWGVGTRDMRAISDQARELRSQIQAQKKKMNMEWGSHFIPKCFLNKSQKRHPFVASRVTMTESRLSGLIIKSIILGLQISNKTLNPSTLHIFRCRSLRWPICQERSILTSVEGTELESLHLRQLKI